MMSVTAAGLEKQDGFDGGHHSPVAGQLRGGFYAYAIVSVHAERTASEYKMTWRQFLVMSSAEPTP
jgi:hypothetical protein